ncbi:TolC family protein [Roseibacterium sp. SDUM158017]|uniref:TolC family protein n=1 Tax=Roseicyclus salinarum TaxID=3036773 RepID=UPI0024152E04|nr:TolC family protein [Roseibacterium sp. SDUM158017]MDG4650073.1 TolC family protein [Roseibacterium sp. SDUM158017]
MRKTLTAAAGAMTTLLLVSACGDGAATRATPERLNALLQDGIDPDRAARADERLARLLGRDNATGALAGPYGGQEDGTGADLGQLLVAALERNTTIGAAAQDINRADAERLNAIFGYLPQISFDATYSQINQRVVESDNAVFQEGEAEYPVLDYRLLVNQPLLDLGRLFGLQVATNARSLAEVTYIATVRDVTFEVTDAYLVALQADRQARFLRQRQELLARQAASNATLQELGLGDITAESSVRGEAASLAAREATELASAAEALGRLSGLTGVTVTGVGATSFPSDVRGVERRVSAQQAVEDGLANNPAIAAAALRAVGGELDRRRALAEDFSPVVSAFASLEYQDRDASRFGGGSVTEDTTIGVSLRVPLFNAAGEGYGSRPARVAGNALVLEYHAARRELETEIVATHNRLAALTRAIGASRNAVTQARRGLQAERERLLSGETVDIAVVGRQLRLNVVESEVDFYDLEYLRAWARLQYLMGRDLSRAGG